MLSNSTNLMNTHSRHPHERIIFLVQSIYEKKNPNPQKIATKGILMVFSPIQYHVQHTKNLIKSEYWKGVIKGVCVHKLINIHEIYIYCHNFGFLHL